MRIARLTLSLVLGLSLTALTASCASFHGKPRAIAETVKQAQSQVALREYKKALALYAAADNKYGRDATLRHHYARTGDRIRSTADTAFKKGGFSKAGEIYRILLVSGITKKNFQEPLSFDKTYLRSRIGSCSKELMERGLVKYRKDDLDGASFIWNKVLAFDPGNRAVAKALQTTNKQRQMLKEYSSVAK